MNKTWEMTVQVVVGSTLQKRPPKTRTERPLRSVREDHYALLLAAQY
jgi:hypothetical protein